MKLASIDLETYLIDEFQGPNPFPICMSFVEGGWDGEIVDSGLFGTEEYDLLREKLLELLNDEEMEIVLQNAKFDMLCLYFHNEEPVKRAIWKAYKENRIKDTIIREKLINLTMYGGIDDIEMMDGAYKKIFYNLAALEKHYLGIDRSDQKSGDNIWRTNYDQLVGIPVAEWPEEAVTYAMDDSVGCFRVCIAQEERRHDIIEVVSHDPFKVQDFRALADFSLGFMTNKGNKIDQDVLIQTRDEFEELYTDPRLVVPLVEAGIIVPARPPEPYARGTKDHALECRAHKDHPEYIAKEARKLLCDCPLKMKKAIPEKESKSVLRAYVRALCESDERFRIKFTPKSVENEKDKAIMELRDVDPSKFTVQVNAEWLTEFSPLDPLLALYFERKAHEKMITTYLPAMFREDGKPAETIRAPFDVLKLTGRTSSFADKLYPSTNGQNADPRIRRCYIPRDGFCLASIDYAGMELGTFAQTCFDMFGYSVLMDKINQGIKPHAYLGATIAHATDTEFSLMCQDQGADSADDWLALFMTFKGNEEPCTSREFQRTWAKDHPDSEPTWNGFFKHYYKFAKPTGLGFPGGLGAETFVTYAKATYGVELDLDLAESLRDIWKKTYPEADAYLKSINKNSKADRFGTKLVTSKSGKKFEAKSFSYTTPMGLHRGRCDYCACANGKGLQSPGAEGALRGVINVVREIYDPASHSILANRGRVEYVRPTIFVHDEIVLEIKMDALLTPRIDRIQTLMNEAMRVTTPDVVSATEPALMMRWNKQAEEVRDEEGNYIPWEPEGE